MTTRVPIRYGGTGANNAADARAALGVLANTGGTIDGDLNITGNLIVSGNTTTLNVETLQVEDNEIVLNFGATTATLNAGIIVNRGSEANVFVRWNEDANAWGWSDDGNTFYSFDTTLTAYGQANLAYDQANTAYGQANSAYGQANDAYAAANTANSNALTAYAQANDAYTRANTANSQANLAYDQANTAANTVRVSQNSGSTLSAKQLNFVNTANVTITVTDSGDGNANVEIFSAAGGGAGIADFPVSANTGSTVTANALNFNNTSSVIVNVESGIDGNANISFTSVGAAANLEILDEGSSITAAVTSIDFVGSGVSATANGSNVTVTISGGGGGGSNTIIGSDLFTSVNADANLTYTLSEAVPGTNYVFVVKNGISLTPGVDYVVEPDYQTLRVIESGAANDSIEVRYFTPLSAVLVPNTTIVIDSNTVTSQTNTFFLTSNVTDITLLTVTKNGLFLTPNSHFTLSDNNTVTLTTIAEVDDELVFRYFRDQGIDEVSNNSVSSVFTANGVSNTYFMNSFALDANNVLVTIDGVVLTPGVDYSVSGPVLTINYVPAANSVIESRTITGGGDGSPATLGFYRNSFVGDGNTVNFTLGQTPYDEDNCLVFVDRVLQRNSEYNVSATTLTFTGAPDANAVVDVFVTNYLATNKALIKTGDTMTGNLNVAATLITQNVEPAANITYDLGTSTKRFKDLWLSNSTIHLGEATISANGGNIVVPSIQTSSGINVESVLADAYNQANSAFSAANNRVLKAGDTMTGELNVANNLVVTGNVGIGGVSSPLAGLHSIGGTILTGATPGLTNPDPTFGGLIFGFDGGTNTAQIAATNPSSSQLALYTKSGGGSAPIEHLRITGAGNVGIGTTTPGTKLDVRPGVYDYIQVESATHSTLTGLSAGIAFSRGSDGSGKLGAIFGWDNGGLAIAARGGIVFAAGGESTYSATNERMRIFDGGSVAIGTTSAPGRLTVGNATSSDNNSLVLNRGVKPSIGAPQVAILSEWNGIGTAESLTFMADAGYKFLDDTGTTEWMRILSSGNIGIGTVTPVTTSLVGALTIYKLHGTDTTSDVPSVTGQSYHNNQSNLFLFGRNSGITIISKNDEGGTINFADDDSAKSGAIDYSHTQDVMSFWTGGNSRVTIRGGGNVGIGTDTVNDRVEVVGPDITLVRSQSSNTSLFSGFRAQTDNAGKNLYLIASNSSRSGSLFGLNYAGNSTIYTNNSGLAIGAADAYDLTLGTNGTERFRIDSSGRVTTPAQPSFMARRTSGFTLTAATVIVYDSELGDRASNYNNSNGRFTAPVSGYYFFKAHVQPVTAGVNVNINFWVNGSGTAYANMGTTNLYARGDIGNEIVLPLNANDYVEVVVFVSSSCGFDNHGIFCGYLIG